MCSPMRTTTKFREPLRSPALPQIQDGLRRAIAGRCPLTFTQSREQDHLPVREFQRIVMRHGVAHVDLPEACELLSNLLARENAEAEGRLAFDILVERNLGTWKQADRNMRLPDCGKAAGDGIVEPGCH